MNNENNKVKKNIKKTRSAKNDQTENEENDLFELIGTNYNKISFKRNFDYEEVMEEMNESSKEIIGEKFKEKLMSDDPRPITDLEYI